MALYYDAAYILEKSYAGSLKSRIYNSQTLRTSPAQVYALVSETKRWNPELKEVVERSGLLTEKKVPCLHTAFQYLDHQMSLIWVSS